jgi:hypothetical protein
MVGTRLPFIAWCIAAFIACGHPKKTSDGGGPGGDGANGDSGPICSQYNAPCTANSDCCSFNCDAMTHVCAPKTCAMTGGACALGTDCCSNACVNNACAAMCVSDGGACTVDGACCSGKCGTAGTCVPLNTSCLTDGNACGVGTGGCCSGFCKNGLCAPGSWCTQNGDVCAHDFDCCGGICTIAAGNSLGTCSQPSVGSTNCQAGVDGTLCSGCNGCCSRLCEVYAPTGQRVCQPAEGCRIDGDLCFTSNDCCGGDPNSGLPGAGNVTCLKQNPTDPVGICRNPIGCDPEGDVCHYKNYVTCGNSSARNDCCGGQGNSGVCKLDPLGVPRCYGLGTMCHMTGMYCSNSLDCCNGLPCVPDGMGHFVCGATMCVNTNGMCTQTSDCCNGATCYIMPGSTTGTCGMGGTCQQQGQACNTTNLMCCMSAGMCTDPSTNMACTAQSTMCTCFTPIL